MRYRIFFVVFILLFTSFSAVAQLIPQPNVHPVQQLSCRVNYSNILVRKNWAPVSLDHQEFLDNILQSPTIANNDIFVTRDNGKFYGFNNAGEPLGQFPWLLTNWDYANPIIATGNVAEDALDEVVVVSKPINDSQGTKVSVFYKAGGDYDLYNSWVIEGFSTLDFHSYPTIGDIDGDEVNEIILFVGNKLYAWHANGNVLPGFPFVADNTSYSSVTLADFDNDGKKEIVAQDTSIGSGNLYLINYQGEELWRRTVRTISMSPVIGDVDNDGELEIIAVETSVYLDNKIFVFDGQGNIEQSWVTGRQFTSNTDAPALADLDNDNDLEIILYHRFNELRNKLYAFHHTGSIVNGWPYGDFFNNAANTSPTIIDICNDGKAEVFAIVENEPFNGEAGNWKLVLLSSNGQVRKEIELKAFSGFSTVFANNVISVPVIKDIDGNGKPEIIFSWFYMAQWGAPTSQYWAFIDAYELNINPFNYTQQTKIVWPQFQGDFSLTGLYYN